jgi:uncharacterized protein
MAELARAVTLQVTVVICVAARQTLEHVLNLPPGATVADALHACGARLPAPGNDSERSVGIWGRKAALDDGLKHLDRVEVYRALVVDPKVARRERFARQGARTTGLFARQRPGGKMGY